MTALSHDALQALGLEARARLDALVAAGASTEGLLAGLLDVLGPPLGVLGLALWDGARRCAAVGDGAVEQGAQHRLALQLGSARELEVQLRHPLDASQVERLQQTLEPSLPLVHVVVELREVHTRLLDLQTLEGRLNLLLVHDLNNPLGVIKTNLALLEEDDEDPVERRQLHGEMMLATDRLLAMLDDLASIRSAELSGLSLQKSLTRVDRWLSSIPIPQERSLGFVPVRVTRSLPPLVAQMDAALLARGVSNILSNAVRYSPVDGEVRISAAARQGALVLTFENDGPHIPETILAGLFDKYGEVRDAGGESLQRYARGLGLYLCRMIVEAHGGTITVRNHAPRGVEFELILPAALVDG